MKITKKKQITKTLISVLNIFITQDIIPTAAYMVYMFIRKCNTVAFMANSNYFSIPFALNEEKLTFRPTDLMWCTVSKLLDSIDTIPVTDIVFCLIALYVCPFTRLHTMNLTSPVFKGIN